MGSIGHEALFGPIFKGDTSVRPLMVKAVRGWISHCMDKAVFSTVGVMVAKYLFSIHSR